MTDHSERIINSVLFSSKVDEDVCTFGNTTILTLTYTLPCGVGIAATVLCSDKTIFDIQTARAFAHGEAAKKLKLIRDFLIAFRSDDDYDIDGMVKELKLDASTAEALESPLPMLTRDDVRSGLWGTR